MNSGEVDPLMAAPFVATAGAGSSIAITTGFIENYGTGAVIDLDIDHVRSGSLNHYAGSGATLYFRIDQPITYELSGAYPNASNQYATFYVSLFNSSANHYKYRGTANLYVPGVMIVGELPNNQTGSITGTLEPGTYSLGLGALLHAHRGGTSTSISVGYVTLWLGEMPCYADCDQSGALDIFDFLCFQNSFVSGEPYACGCDPDPVCDIFDFLCFQNAFVAGCP